MPVNAIHIGLPKTATTYIQNCWALDGNIGIGFHGLVPWITWARGVAEGIDAPEPQINIDHRPKSGSNLVLTNEALSMHSLNQGASEETCRTYIALVAETLGKKKLTRNVIITIRNPIPWVRSLYSQSIKQGDDETFVEFLDRQAPVLRSSLDLQGLYETYERHFSRPPLILSTEELSAEPDRFWGRVSRYSHLPTPSAQAVERAQSMRNERLSPAGISFARQLHRQRRVVEDAITRHQPLDLVGDLVNRNRDAATALFRTATEGVPDETIHRMAQDANIPIRETDLDGVIPDDLLAHIEHRFIDWLASGDQLDTGILDQYRESLAEERAAGVRPAS